jgi:hypothetical protein
VRVQHRHIIYIQGYDPRGLAQYYRMFRTELRKFGRLYQLSASMGRPQAATDGEIASWTIETKADDWQTRTSTTSCASRISSSATSLADLAHVFQAVWIYWRLVFAGTIARFWRANWRFATFITYPHFLLLLEAVCAAALAVAFEGAGCHRHPQSVQYRGGDSGLRRDPRHGAEIYREPDLPALRAVGHHLDLGILAPRAARMGPAYRPLLRSIWSRSRAKAMPRKSSLSAIVRDRSWEPRCWRGRCSSIPRSAAMARASCF